MKEYILKEITLKDAGQAFKKNLPKIIIIMAICAILTVVFGKISSSDSYTSNISILVGAPQDFNSEGIFIEDTRLTLNQQVVRNVEQILKSDRVADDVAKEINNSEIDAKKLKEDVKILIVDGTSIINLEYTSPDKDLSNKVLETFYERANKLSDEYMGKTTLQILDPASSNNVEKSHILKEVIIGGFLGLLIGIAYSFISFYHDPVIYNKYQFKDNTDLDNLATLPKNYNNDNEEALRLLNAKISSKKDLALFSYNIDTRDLADQYNNSFDSKLKSVSPIKNRPKLLDELLGIEEGIVVYQNEITKVSEIEAVLQAMNSLNIKAVGALQISELKSDNKKYMPYA